MITHTTVYREYIPTKFTRDNLEKLQDIVRRNIYYEATATESLITLWPIGFIHGHDPLRIYPEKFIPTDTDVYRIELVHEDDLDDEIPNEYFSARWAISFEQAIEKALHFYDEKDKYWNCPGFPR